MTKKNYPRGSILEELSKKLIRLSGNDLINKRLSGNGLGGVFNVCDELPQFVLDHLLAGKKFKILGLQDPEEYLGDEQSKEFEKGWANLLEQRQVSEDELEEADERALKDELREIMELPPTEEMIPDHKVDLPERAIEGDEMDRHVDSNLQTDLSEEKLRKCLEKIERERIRFEREKGLQTLFAAFGFIEWESEGKKYNSPLLLMRVNLEKQGNVYKLISAGEVEDNESLGFALHKETQKVMPLSSDFYSEDGAFDLYSYLSEIRTYCEKFESWRVRTRIAVGIFKSRGIPFSEILGDQYSEESVDRTEQLLIGTDCLASKGEKRNVDEPSYASMVPGFALSADSSQHSAILEVAEGKDLVIEGPPGTGKSQTIVNLIANALYHGKSVLFLAQKLAALEVVNHRLNKVGLGSKCISLHSEYTSKARLFEEVKEKIYPSADHIKVSSSQFERIRAERDSCLTALNDHSYKLNRQLGAKGSEVDEEHELIAQQVLTTYALIKSRIKDEPVPPIRLPEGYDLREIQKDIELVKSMQVTLSESKEGDLSFLKICKYKQELGPFEISEQFSKIKSLLQELEELIPDTHRTMSCESMINWKNTEEQKVASKKRFDERIRELGKYINDKNQKPALSDFRKSTDIIKDGNALGRSISSIFPWSKTAKAKKYLRNLLNKPKGKLSEFYSVIGPLEQCLESLEKEEKYLTSQNALSDDVSKLENDYSWVSSRCEKLIQARDLLEGMDCGTGDQTGAHFVAILHMFLQWENDFRIFYETNQTLSNLEQKLGVGEWMRGIIGQERNLSELFEAHIYRFFAVTLEKDSREIFSMDGKTLESLRSKFKELENESREKFVGLVGSRMPIEDQVPSEIGRKVRDKRGLALLKHVAERPNARITVREFVHRSSDALKCYCPCFLMTPSSVADYLPKDVSFDLLIIDEASQMLPEEAVGSILRSKQVVVVGDPKQMPPMRYMQSTLKEDEDTDDGPNESILDKAMLAFKHFRRLSYHYRSEDESLIRFSNNEFYENDLMTVPNLKHDEEYGVHHVHAGGVYNSGNANWVSVEEDGQMASWSPSKNPNPIEADRLVEIIEEEIRTRPNWSIGVAVMNLKQAIRVEELFQAKIDNTILDYLNRWKKTPEYFFIKNLENVQGDERDTIIIATVYGKNKEGKMFQRFGPINLEKGENRINVLVTRAKKRVVVCTSMDPNDITNQSTGPQVFRRYLQFAKTGILEDTATQNISDHGDLYDSPWEKWFHDRLEADGYNVNPQVGVSGWRIDLGVMHPDYPDGYLCGIELDGKDHLRQSARDRDIERQAILESKGWTILRVWSVDFFSDPEGEYSLLKKEIDSLLEQKRAHVEEPVVEPFEVQEKDSKDETNTSLVMF